MSRVFNYIYLIIGFSPAHCSSAEVKNQWQLNTKPKKPLLPKYAWVCDMSVYICLCIRGFVWVQDNDRMIGRQGVGLIQC